ncbi:hypothetical protein [Bifidobacterium avesanii]|uniref:hypothetical protein n=1 Tax=Bifidobacterium avesanii TaxID=1798157 RepID=UPI0013822535|nr:hypothetical protein [Bifidobacterium avesanii]KAB8294528.1 hypothetical protein DSM100685_0321 [Bifidobacterium avesanii]
MSHVIKCDRCRRRFRMGAKDAEYWNLVFRDGRPTAVLCPDCQTDAEALEAQVNEATLDYRRARVLPDGRACAPYKRTEALR